MIIFLCICGEIISVGLSFFITIKGFCDIVLEIPKNGYKIDKKILEEYKRKHDENKSKDISIFRRILGTIILLTPGVNVIRSAVMINKVKKGILDVPEIQDAIVPMTDEEKEEYNSLKGYFEKLAFSSFVIDNDDEKKQEFVTIVDGKAVICDHDLTSIYYGKLLPLDYTLEEVKHLNAATGYSYRIGKMDNENVAIIGIPDSDSSITHLRFKTENLDMIRTYEEMSEEEAQGQTFTVYPFTVYDDTREDVEKVIQEIKQSRIDSATKANLDGLNIHMEAPGVEIGYGKSDLSSEDMMSYMEESIFEGEAKEQGPTLRKKF